MSTVLRSALLGGKTSSSQAVCVVVFILYAGSGICLDQTFCSRKNQFMICPSELKHGIIHSQTTVVVVVDWLVKPRDLSAIWRTSQYWCSLLHPIPLLSFIFSFDLAIGIVVLLQKIPICHGINTPKKKYAAYSALFLLCALQAQSSLLQYNFLI